MTDKDGYEAWRITFQSSEQAARAAFADAARHRAELERERLRLAACGAVAMSDTPESAAKNRDMHEDYKSASCDDVARRVDECIRLRADVARLTDHLRKANSSAEHFEREWYLRGDEIERLEAEKADAVKDAERWRFTRDGDHDLVLARLDRCGCGSVTGISGEVLDYDKTIDAAMRGDREDG